MDPIWKLLHLWIVFFLLVLVQAQPGGPLQRLPNTTLQMPANPLAYGYSWTNALGALIFTNPVALASSRTRRMSWPIYISMAMLCCMPWMPPGMWAQWSCAKCRCRPSWRINPNIPWQV